MEDEREYQVLKSNKCILHFNQNVLTPFKMIYLTATLSLNCKKAQLSFPETASCQGAIQWPFLSWRAFQVLPANRIHPTKTATLSESAVYATVHSGYRGLTYNTSIVMNIFEYVVTWYWLTFNDSPIWTNANRALASVDFEYELASVSMR